MLKDTSSACAQDIGTMRKLDKGIGGNIGVIYRVSRPFCDSC